MVFFCSHSPWMCLINMRSNQQTRISVYRSTSILYAGNNGVPISEWTHVDLSRQNSENCVYVELVAENQISVCVSMFIYWFRFTRRTAIVGAAKQIQRRLRVEECFVGLIEYILFLWSTVDVSIDAFIPACSRVAGNLNSNSWVDDNMVLFKKSHVI